MPAENLASRPYRCFLSHAHVDSEIVTTLHNWLSGTAGYEIWFDAIHFPAGLVASRLGTAIEECQAAIIVLSNSSIESGWVEQEWNICIEQQNQLPDFQIILVRIDECELPAALRVRKWIDVRDDLTVDAATQIIEALHSRETDPATLGRRQVYLARGNRPDEVTLPNRASEILHHHSVRVVRDAPDQKSFDIERVGSIIESCGALVAFVSDRGEGRVSKYICREIEVARALQIPVRAFVEHTVNDQNLPTLDPVETIEIPDNASAEGLMSNVLAELSEEPLEPVKPAHCFFGHSFSSDHSSFWPVAKRAIQVTTGVPCLSGDDILGGDVQDQILSRIRDSTFCAFDITDDRLNSCIEAGIALGANANFELVCKAPRRRPPFMFRNRQVFFYESRAEMVGLLRRLASPHRRVVV